MKKIIKHFKDGFKDFKEASIKFLRTYKVLYYDPLQTIITVSLLASLLFVTSIIFYTIVYLEAYASTKAVILIESIIALILIGIVKIVVKLYYDIKNESS